MPNPSQVVTQINEIVRYLVEVGLSDDQRFAFQRTLDNGAIEVTFQGADDISIALRNRAYDEVYGHLMEARAYNVKMPDGALIQMMYRYVRGTLRSHRLAFFPSPNLEEFQNDPEIYLQEEIYADVVARNIVPFPLRFDYDTLSQTHAGTSHPSSHLTLGQYEHCRIPVTAPVPPIRFADFILRNFYHTAFLRYADRLPVFPESFDETILPVERNLMHVVVPT